MSIKTIGHVPQLATGQQLDRARPRVARDLADQARVARLAEHALGGRAVVTHALPCEVLVVQHRLLLLEHGVRVGGERPAAVEGVHRLAQEQQHRVLLEHDAVHQLEAPSPHTPVGHGVRARQGGVQPRRARGRHERVPTLPPHVRLATGSAEAVDQPGRLRQLHPVGLAAPALVHGGHVAPADEDLRVEPVQERHAPRLARRLARGGVALELQADLRVCSVLQRLGGLDATHEAVLTGANEGLKLTLGIVALLIALVGLVSLANGIIGWFGAQGSHVGLPLGDITIQKILGWIYYPFTVLIGIDIRDAGAISTLLGQRTVLTEVISYQNLAGLIANNELMDPGRTAVLASYALCGFAHVAAIAIFVGGISVLVPSRAADIARLGFRAMVAATLACFQTAAVAGIFITSGNSILFGG